MSSRADVRHFEAAVVGREVLSEHFIRVVLGGPGLSGFASTGVPDEWVALTVPGQFQTRYYTVRSWDGIELVLDVVVHEHGLVTEWAQTECLGQTVTISEPKGSFALPEGARWLVLVGDLTALPAVARIAESVRDIPVTAIAEVPDGEPEGYLDVAIEMTWLAPPGPGESALADVVGAISWPAGPGYFWMAGESAQMRAIRKHVRHDVGMDSRSYDVMGYWSQSRGRRTRAVDPGPVYRRGKAEGRTDEQIWADYDALRESR